MSKIRPRISPTLRMLLLALISVPLLTALATPSYAIKQRPSSYYAQHKVSLILSSNTPVVGEPVVFKANIEPFVDENDVEYQFLINGEPIAEAGMHKIHTFQTSGSYKLSAVATLGHSYLINSPTKIIDVVQEWRVPVAEITPRVLTLKTGKTAIFRSSSEVDSKSRQWLYWSISSGHRGNGETFTVNTRDLKEGKYTIKLLLKDDHKNESTGYATLIINNNAANTSQVQQVQSEEQSETLATPIASKTSKPLDLTFRSSHKHRFTEMPIIYWVQNSQIGANTQLQLDTGDGFVSPWGRRLRYSHIYKRAGIYTAQLSTKINNRSATSQQSAQQHTLTVYIWPRWLLLVIIGSILLFIFIIFFKRRGKRLSTKKSTYTRNSNSTTQLNYTHYPDDGYQQMTMIAESAQKSTTFTLNQQLDAGTQTLKTTKGEQQHGTHNNY